MDKIDLKSKDLDSVNENLFTIEIIEKNIEIKDN